MKPLTPSEQALAAYFYTIANDPAVKAAGLSPTKFKDAVLARASQDIVAVAAFTLRGGAAMVEPKVAQATRAAASTMLGGTVSPKVADEIATGVEALVKGGFKWLGDLVDKLEDRGKRKK